MEQTYTTDTLIIGGGIAGLTAAWQLQKRGHRVVLLEGAARPGGLIRTIDESSFLKEAGPNAFLGDAEPLRALAREVGLGEQIIDTPPVAANRFIFFRGALHRVPRGPGSLLTTHLLTTRGKLRLLCEFFCPPLHYQPHSGAPQTPVREENVAQFVTRRLGAEVLERLVDPLVAGIFAGDPEQLSLSAAFPKMALMEERYGGLLRAAIRGRKRWRARTVRSFSSGMGMLPMAIAQHLGDIVQVASVVTELRRADDGTFVAIVKQPDGVREWRAHRVICATPAYSTATLLKDLSPSASALLQNICYAPIIVAHVAYARHDCPHPCEGFGFLVPQRTTVRCLGALWTSACFPTRAPHDTFLCTLFYGGMRDPVAIGLSDDDLRTLIASDTRATMGMTAPPIHCGLVRHPAAIPQYTIGHRARIAQIQHALAMLPGLYLTGNYLAGTSVSDTIANAIAVSKSCHNI